MKNTEIPLPPQLRKTDPQPLNVCPDTTEQLPEQHTNAPYTVVRHRKELSRQRNRKTWWTIDDAGYTGEPATLWEGIKRAFVAWQKRRRVKLPAYRYFRRRRRMEKYQTRLGRIIRGDTPFPRRRYATRDEYGRRVQRRDRAIMEAVQFRYSSKPRTLWERARRYCRACELLDRLHQEGWQGLGFYFRHRNNVHLSPEAERLHNFRDAWVHRNRLRLDRIRRGEKPFRPSQIDDLDGEY